MTADTLPADVVEDLRLLVYSQLASYGRAAATDDLAAALHVTPRQVANGLRALHTTRDLVLDDSGGIVLAHPS